MRILWYWPHPHGGPSRLALSMLRPGDELTVEALCRYRGQELPPVREYSVVRDLPDPNDCTGGPLRRGARRPMLTLSRSVRRARLARRGFDVIHLQVLVYLTDWADLRHLGRATSLVSVVHDVRPHRNHVGSGLEQRLLRSTYHHAGDLVVFHDVLRDELVEDFGVDRERVHVIPHPLDARDLRDPTVPRPQRALFLFFGTLRPNKGIDILLTAVRRLGSDLDADVVVAGAGSHEVHQRLGREACDLPNVRLELGYVPYERKRFLFSQASWVVLPYTAFHSQSGVLADAYAYRVPAIVTSVGGMGPTIEEDRTGLVVEPNDAHALASALLQAATVTHRGGTEYRDNIESAAQQHDHARVGPLLRNVYDVAYRRRARN